MQHCLNKFVAIYHANAFSKLTVLSTYNKLKDALAKESLNLMSLGDEKPVDDNTEDVLKAWLIGVSVGLGSLCIILVVVFAIKLRRY